MLLFHFRSLLLFYNQILPNFFRCIFYILWYFVGVFHWWYFDIFASHSCSFLLWQFNFVFHSLLSRMGQVKLWWWIYEQVIFLCVYDYWYIFVCLFVAVVAPVGYQGWCPIIPKSVGFVSNKILSRFTRADSTRQSPYLVKPNLMMMMMYLIGFAFCWAFSFFNINHPKYICLRWMRRSGST